MTFNTAAFAACAVVIAALWHIPPAAGDIYQWEWVDPDDSSQGRWQSSTLAPDGAGVSADQEVDLSLRDLSKAYLSGVELFRANLAETNLRNADLTGAMLGSADLTNADLSGAFVKGAFLGGTTHYGFTKEQLYSTASYQQGDLTGLHLAFNNVNGWDFHHQIIAHVNFSGVQGLTQEQLYSTQSYQDGELIGIAFGGWPYGNSGLDLTGWDFSGQDLTYASFVDSNLAGTKFAGAIVAGGRFGGDTNLTESQLYETKSYQDGDLRRVRFGSSYISGWSSLDMTGWDLSSQDLHQASFLGCDLDAADLTAGRLTNVFFGYYAHFEDTIFDFADLRGAIFADYREVSAPSDCCSLRNAIRGDGEIHTLSLDESERLTIRDYDGVSDPPPAHWLTPKPPIAIYVLEQMDVAQDATLQLVVDADPWNSLISFEAGIPVNLGGTLELTFADHVDVATQVGRTLHIFDWQGVDPSGKFEVSSPYAWDISSLYTAGEVTLLAVPEPAGWEACLLATVLVTALRGRQLRTVGVAFR